MTVQDTKGGTRPTPKRYKSPQHKLVRFFEKSRNQWKAKCREAKALVKRLKNRVRWLEHSRDCWKRRAQALDVELTQARERQQALETQMVQKKKLEPSMSRTVTP